MTQGRDGTISAFVMLTIDGYYEGPGGAFDFWKLDTSFERFSNQQLDEFDALVFGRRTYEGMAEYWTTSDAALQSPETARRMNELPKVVVSTTLSSPTWAGTSALASLEELERRHRETNEAMLVLGSPTLLGSLIDRRLLDELRIMVNPVTVGGGGAFGRAVPPMDYSLREVRRIGSGNVVCSYRMS